MEIEEEVVKPSRSATSTNVFEGKIRTRSWYKKFTFGDIDIGECNSYSKMGRILGYELPSASNRNGVKTVYQ